MKKCKFAPRIEIKGRNAQLVAHGEWRSNRDVLCHVVALIMCFTRFVPNGFKNRLKCALLRIPVYNFVKFIGLWLT